ncbi:MAG: molybdopterin oxidoreductase [Chloroflexi bacterium]|jgi:molybdopterin-containing oxidoreductase family membrane subunit|nr:molybdopterin oxidoreductase [Chloroflexota bacterium]MBD86562.1 molybdopterin oxidoreductase [Chloroflexota bacterium]MBI67296.1 molybdopterin oxidoreductase [Chloroflexota bacterium]MCH2531959.1 polysulfide reductase NrfD [Dehalococcoidia bacterium]HCH36033.1 molybdopterin oxidoreductase [Dehalococcoidia bacterium]|tara:strand:+ start:2605 stop:3978 length:1374 start_codon:yes stop_codon:yes gene_type:complete
MYYRRTLTDAQINKELLDVVFRTPTWWVILVSALGLMVAIGAGAFGFMMNKGLGVTGLHQPVFWGFFITNFIFWVGISHAGVMISAILRLSQAEWRRPMVRAAETMTVFALMTSLLQPLIHAGRPWRIFYWVFPYDWARGIWPDVRSPLVWDPTAIITYLTSSILFVYTALIPDLAIIRDRSTGWKRTVYGILALGWHGNPRQWKLQGIAGILLSALILPVFVSVHSIVSWDFGVSLVPSWHVTVFAPYFVIGAVHSGVSAVVTLMIVMRKLYKLENYIWEEHIDAVARLLIVVATAWLFFFWLDIVFAFWLKEEQELTVWNLRLFEAPWSWFFLVFITASYIIPVPLWLFRRVRRSFTWMLWTSLLVNVGMFLERLIIIVPALMRKGPWTFNYDTYAPSIVEITLVVASIALVCFLLLVFSKFFPLIPIWEIKEGQRLIEEVKVGNRVVPALVKED